MAQTNITGAQIKDDTLTADDIADGAVRGATANNGTQREFASGTLSTPDLRDEAVTNAKVSTTAAIAESKLSLTYSTSSLNTAISGKQASLGYTPVNKAGDTMGGALAMGGYKITGLGAPTVNGDALRYDLLGANSGIATLDSGGKIPVTQLPSSVMEYQGAWNVSTNNPTLTDGTGNAGDIYIISTGGTRNLGSGSISFVAGDWIVYNGSIWQKAVNSAAVASVNGYSGAVTLAASDLSLGTSNNVQFAQVAIGTSSPIDKLSVVGNATLQGVDGWNSTGNLAKLSFGTATAANVYGIAAVYGTGLYLDVYRASGAGKLGTNSYDAISILETSGYVGLGITPAAPLHVASSTTLAAGLPSILLQGSSNTERIGIRSTSVSIFTAASCNGTIASPTAVTTDQVLGGYQFGGYGATAWQRGAQITGWAAGTWTDTSAPGYITFQTVSSGTTTNTERMRIDSVGNVGIGCTPSQLLTVNGTAQFGSTGSTFHAYDTVKVLSAGAPVLAMEYSGAGTSYHTTDSSGNGVIAGQAGLLFKYGVAFATGPIASGTVGMTLDSSGKLGIGVSPSNKLHVYMNTTGNTTPVKVENTSATGSCVLQLMSSTQECDLFSDISNTRCGIYMNADVPFLFYANGGEVMRYNKTGLGIGVTPSTYKLEVAGTVGTGAHTITVGSNSGLTVTDSIVTGIAFPSTALTHSYAVGTTSNHPMLFGTNNTYSVILDTNQRLGINNTSPVCKLHVTGTGLAWPATTGSTQSAGHIARLGSNNAVLDIGSNSASGLWIQATDQTGLNINYPLNLNPNGGAVSIGTSTTNYGSLYIAAQATTNPTTVFIQGYNATGSADTRCGTFRNAFDGNGSYGTYWTPYRGANGSFYRAIFGVATSGVDNDVLTLDSLGKVGIGTLSPIKTLEVMAGNDNGLVVTNAANSGGIINFVGTSGGTTAWVGAISNHPLSLITNNTVRLAITAAGNVGIKTGTTSLSYSCQIGSSSGGAGSLAVVDAGGNLGFLANGTTNTQIWQTLSFNNEAHINTSGSTDILLQPNGSTAVTIKNGGNIIIPGVYSQTSANAANVVVDSSGNVMRSTSSLRYKTNVLDLSLEDAQKLLDITPITYKSLSTSDNPEDRHYGFVAEEVDLIDPMLVQYRDNLDNTKTPDGVQYDRVVVGLLKLVQDLTARVKALESK